MAHIRTEIQCKNKETEQLILSAYYRSCIIFYLTPLRAAGLMTPEEVSQVEVNMLRK